MIYKKEFYRPNLKDLFDYYKIDQSVNDYYKKDNANLFELVFEEMYKKFPYDTCEMIDAYFKHSMLQNSMDRYFQDSLDAGHKMVLRSVNFDNYNLSKNKPEYQLDVLYVMAEVYMTLHFDKFLYCSDISELISAKELYNICDLTLKNNIDKSYIIPYIYDHYIEPNLDKIEYDSFPIPPEAEGDKEYE